MEPILNFYLMLLVLEARSIKCVSYLFSYVDSIIQYLDIKFAGKKANKMWNKGSEQKMQLIFLANIQHKQT